MITPEEYAKETYENCQLIIKYLEWISKDIEQGG